MFFSRQEIELGDVGETELKAGGHSGGQKANSEGNQGGKSLFLEGKGSSQGRASARDGKAPKSQTRADLLGGWGGGWEVGGGKG